jgi:hypothetical protein
MIFQNIEYGINCKLYININLFIKGLLYHNGVYFDFRYKRSYGEVKHQRYRIKIYNKSKQYQMQENVIRLELSINKMEEIKEMRIKSFDNINTTTLNLLSKALLRRLEEVTHYDYTITKKELSKSNKSLINLYSDPNYWLHTLKPNQRYRQKKNLKKITDNHSDYTFDTIKKELVNKCSILNRLSKNDNCSIINYSYIELNTLQESTRKCIATGIDLKLEKGNEKYVKAKTIKGLKKYVKDTYIMICSSLLNNTSSNLPM